MNEKGEWRKTAHETLTELQNVKAEMAAMRTNPVQPQNTGYGYNNGYTAPQNYGPVPPPQTPAGPETYFPDKKEEDLVEVGDMNRMVQGIIAPAVQQLQQQQLFLQQQQTQAVKINAGITPVIEQRLTQSYAWLQGMPEGPQKVEAMSSLLRSEQTTQRQAKTVQTQVPMQHPAQAAARRVTYVENANQAATQQESETIQQRVAREFMAETTAAGKRKILEKYGMNAVNDFGPDVYTR